MRREYTIKSKNSLFIQNSLRENVFWMLLGNGGYACLQWIQLSVIAKFSTPYILGSYTLAYAIAGPLFLFLSFQLRALLVTDTRNEWSLGSYFVLRIICMITGICLITGYLFIQRESSLILFLVTLLKSIEGVAEIFNSQQQLTERMDFVAKSLLLKGVFSTISIWIGVYFLHSLFMGLSFAILLNSVILILYDYYNCRSYFSLSSIREVRFWDLKSLIIRSVPLGVVIWLVSLNTNISKYIVQHDLGYEMQGIYSTLAYCLVLGNFVNSAIGQSFSPRLSKYYSENRRTDFLVLVRKYLFVNFLMGSLLFAISLLAGSYFLKLMFSTQIAEYTSLFSWIMFSGIFLYMASALGYTLTSMRIFKIQPFINVIILLINLVGSLLFIRLYGLKGVVYASVLAYSVQCLITGYFIKKHIVI